MWDLLMNCPLRYKGAVDHHATDRQIQDVSQ